MQMILLGRAIGGPRRTEGGMRGADAPSRAIHRASARSPSARSLPGSPKRTSFMRASPRERPAVDRVGLAGDEARFVGAQIERKVRDLLRCAHAADRLRFGKRAEHL